MKNKIIYLTLAFSGLLCACNDWLDPNEYALLQKDQVFDVSSKVNKMSAGIYGKIPHATELGMSAATDEGEMVDNTDPLHAFNNGTWGKYNNPDDIWSSAYDGIRIAMDLLKESEDTDWEEWKYSNPTKYEQMFRELNMGRAEARFLSAYLYFELMRRYGEVPLITEKIDLSPDMDLSQFKRNSVAEIMDYICQQCDIVCQEGEWKLSPEQVEEMTEGGRKHLPAPYRDTLALAYPTSGEMAAYLGRATKGSAYALKAKALVYYASKAFNPENDMERWKKAAEACKKVLDLPKEYYDLEPDFAKLFTKGQEWSKEFLFVRKMSASNSFERKHVPVSIQGGNTGMCPSQNLVDAFEVLIKDDAGKVIGCEPFDWQKEEHKTAPYANRDPRMAVTVYHHGDKYTNEEQYFIVLNCAVGGNAGPDLYHGSKTGYYLGKYVNTTLHLRNNKTAPKTWMLMRMADFYLLYAEAMNEYYGPNNPGEFGMTALEALNKIRTRAGMPEVNPRTKEQMREAVYHERQVELAFENQRWWDVRRWKYGQLFNSPLRGVEVVNHEDGTTTFAPKIVEERVFDESKMYLYPIPQSEIDKGGLEQNINW